MDELSDVAVVEALRRQLMIAAPKQQDDDYHQDRIVMTKVGQIVWLGSLLELFEEEPIPLSYVGLAQKVPEDLVAGSAQYLAEAVIGERSADLADAASLGGL